MMVELHEENVVREMQKWKKKMNKLTSKINDFFETTTEDINDLKHNYDRIFKDICQINEMLAKMTSP